MTDSDFAKEINSFIQDKKDERKAEARREAEATEAFEKGFAELSEKVILPLYRETKRALESDEEYKVQVTAYREEEYDLVGQAIVVKTGSSEHDNQSLSLSFEAEIGMHEVRCFISSNSGDESIYRYNDDVYELGEVTPELVKKKLFEFVEKLF